MFWQGRRVLLTGHTGFKGAWLTLWLSSLGSRVTGFSHEMLADGLFSRAKLDSVLAHDLRGDVRNRESLTEAFDKSDPEIVFHLAAQPIVSISYEQPAETFDVNIMGTVHVLEEIRQRGKPCVVVVVTSDKCYQPHIEGREHRENDPLGGNDPYSASKGAAEVVTHAYRQSYFGPHAKIRVATARAGNVIGGGDWAKDRLLPDAARSLLSHQPINIRNPEYIRPWQHVLEPLSGYLALAERLYSTSDSAWSSSWNFGPNSNDNVSVRKIVEWFIESWGDGEWRCTEIAQPIAETQRLRLCIDKARNELKWQPRWTAREAAHRAAMWYKNAAESSNPTEVRQLTMNDLEDYCLAGPALDHLTPANLKNNKP